MEHTKQVSKHHLERCWVTVSHQNSLESELFQQIFPHWVFWLCLAHHHDVHCIWFASFSYSSDPVWKRAPVVFLHWFIHFSLTKLNLFLLHKSFASYDWLTDRYEWVADERTLDCATRFQSAERRNEDHVSMEAAGEDCSRASASFSTIWLQVRRREDNQVNEPPSESQPY